MGTSWVYNSEDQVAEREGSCDSIFSDARSGELPDEHL